MANPERESRRDDSKQPRRRIQETYPEGEAI